jgi:hypothetical protein
MKRLAEEKAKAIEAGAPHADIVDKAYTVTFKGSSSKVGDIEKEKELAAGKNPDETKTEKGKRTYSPEEVRSKAKAFASSGKLSPEERRVLTEILGES